MSFSLVMVVLQLERPLDQPTVYLYPMANRTSYKFLAQRLGDNHYVVPAKYDMKVDVHAYLSDELYHSSEEEMWNQAASGACYEGVTGVYLMPDCHVGFGVPVGSVIVTENTLIQASVGYDISCGILHMRVDGLSASGVRSRYNRERWIREVEKRIALGVGSHRPELMPEFKRTTLDEILRYGAKPLGVKADVCERQFLPVSDEAKLDSIPKAYGKALAQLGSLGGGNHFIELQVDAQDGSVWVMIHCGSRGYGYQTAEHYFYEGARVRDLAMNRRGLSWLRDDEPLGKEYWDHHNAAGNYAIANRHAIAAGIREALQEIYNADGEVFYEISHNLVQKETLVLPDGTKKQGYVHRKGATRAMPAGHPNLVGTSWAELGHPCLIPGSMFEGAAILTPQAGAHASACSVNHGSGRTMARNVAKRKLEHKQERIDAQMHDISRVFAGVTVEGIVTNSKHIPLDESDSCYKNLDSVLSVLEGAGVARMSRRLYPVACLKGTD
jgi:tRNA-splicing ligase RtcB